MWTLVGNGAVLPIIAFVLVGLVIGHLLGGPTPENRTALAFSTASRHPGLHGWRYDMTTGCTLHVKDFDVATYPVKIVDGKIMVAVAAPPPAAG
jgi:hypothetical protein